MMIREHNGIRYTLKHEVNGKIFDTEKEANIYAFDLHYSTRILYGVNLVITNAEPV